MADDADKKESGKESDGSSLAVIIFIILAVILIGERLENRDTLENTSVQQGVTMNENEIDSGAKIARELGIYDPRLLLAEKLQNGGSLVPVNQGTLVPINRGTLVDVDAPSLSLPENGNPAAGSESIESQEPEFTMERPLFGVGDIQKGKNILMISDMPVRRTVAGTIIGEQLRKAKGIVKEGPVDAVGFRWWGIDFENVPDGWVPEGSFSANTGIYSFLFFWPALFSFIRWIVIFIVALLVIVMLVVKSKKRKSEALREKKKKTNLSYKEQKKLDEFERTPVVNEKWQKIRTYMLSNNHVEWRQAILESDIMLDEMLTKIGYAGQSVGEKLKNVEESDFVTLQKAWEAHKVRNRIAHGGADEVRLDRREAERVIGLYEEVFKEFFYI